jgi:hypothetical protein
MPAGELCDKLSFRLSHNRRQPRRMQAGRSNEGPALEIMTGLTQHR